jgi:hypothetical protein
LQHFRIYYTNTNVTVGEVREAVAKEIDGTGKCLDIEPCKESLDRNTNSKFLVIWCML